MDKFEPIKEKPQWLFNQRAQCAVKVDYKGHTIETVRTDRFNSALEAIELHEQSCKCIKCEEMDS